jgi:hypothetical protein
MALRFSVRELAQCGRILGLSDWILTSQRSSALNPCSNRQTYAPSRTLSALNISVPFAFLHCFKEPYSWSTFQFVPPSLLAITDARTAQSVQPWFDSRQGLLFSPQLPDRVWGPPGPPIQWALDTLSMGVKLTDPSRPSMSRLKMHGVTPSLPRTFSWRDA